MRGISFIFNFSWRYRAFFTLLACIFVTELMILSYRQTHKTAFQNFAEVERILDLIEERPLNSEYVILGDSTARAALDVQEFRFTRSEAAPLASNEGARIIGQYFVLQRYLEKNKKPKGVILLSQNLLPILPRGDDYNTILRFRRVFLRPDEIWETLIHDHQYMQAMHMLINKILPSYRYRLSLAQFFPKPLHHPPVFERAPEEMTTLSREDPLDDDGLFTFLPKPKRVEEFYLFKKIELLAEMDIRVYYVLTAFPESRYERMKTDGSWAELQGYLRGLARKYSNFTYVETAHFVYPDENFQPDMKHLKPEANARFALDLSQALKGIIPEFAVPEL